MQMLNYEYVNLLIFNRSENKFKTALSISANEAGGVRS